MNCNLQNNIINTYSNDYKFFFSKPNVEGIGFGYKYTNGLCTLQSCIQVFVSKKIQCNCLSSNALIPALHKGIKTDVIETGTFNANCTSNCNNSINFKSLIPHPYLKRIRPIQPGYAMSNTFDADPEPFTGTFGYIVTDNEQISKTYCLLSTNSTFANFNQYPIGTNVLQPSYLLGGRPPKDIVGKLLRFCPLVFSNTIPNTLENFNTIDASIATFVNISQIQLINPFIPNIGVPRGIGSPSLGLPIKWTGCLLGTEYGNITSTNSIINVFYQNNKRAWFKDVILGRGSTTFSDFGALVCDETLLSLGLLFANSTYDTVCICNIKNIMDILKVTLLTI